MSTSYERTNVKEPGMSAKRISRVVAAGALLAATVPAFADHDHWNRGYTYGPQPVQQVYSSEAYGPAPVYGQVVYPQPQPVYGHPGYPQPVYGQPVYSGPVYAEPAPVYHGSHHRRRGGTNVVGAAAGGAIGAVIGSQIGDYRTRPAMTAVGAAVGALLGSQF